MNCYEFQGNISSYIEKELSLSNVKEFDHHLETCPSCEDSYEGVLSVLDSLRESKRVAVSSGFDARLHSRIRSPVAGPSKRYRRYLQGLRVFGFEPRYAVASVAALILIIVLSIGLLPEKEGITTGNPAPPTTHRDYPESNAPVSSSQHQFADDAKDDSTDTPRDVPGQRGKFEEKIRLVKDQN